MDVYFAAWVANAIFDISGIWPEDPRRLARKRSLTCDESRAGSCQWVCREYSDPVDLGNMRVSARVLANLMLPRQKPS
jgi:hypothetical protein